MSNTFWEYQWPIANGFLGLSSVFVIFYGFSVNKQIRYYTFYFFALSVYNITFFSINLHYLYSIELLHNHWIYLLLISLGPPNLITLILLILLCYFKIKPIKPIIPMFYGYCGFSLFFILCWHTVFYFVNDTINQNLIKRKCFFYFLIFDFFF